jgi:chromosome segregation ATPase
MRPLDLLKATKTLWGLTAPWFAWVAAAALLILPVLALIKLWWSVRTESRPIEEASKRIGQMKSRSPFDPRRGLSSAVFSQLADIFPKSSPLYNPWNSFAADMVCRRQSSGDEQYWNSEDAEKAFSEDSVYGSRVNLSFYSSLPGIVTGTGLLFTFLAILVALLDVKITETQQITGLDLLIQGLSGKFVSSIAALLSATTFLLFERILLHRLARARLQLVEMLNAFVPKLTSARLLAELQRDISEQSVAFRSFNADLSNKLKQGFSEGLGPTIQRMVESIEELNNHLRAAEAQKQESITGSVSSLVQGLQQSITSSLQTMGDKFKESLSGTATDEFSKVTESLGGAARLLESMNAQFMGTQAAMTELVHLAKSSTAEQLALGKSQVEDLTNVLRQFMIHMNESAGSSVTQMAATLTGVVHDLSNRVSELGVKMAETLERNAEHASHTAATVVEKADKWSTQSAHQLERLIGQLETHSKNTKEIENTLMAALGLFNNSLSQYASLNAGLNKIASEVNAMASSAAGASHSASESQKSLQQISAQTSTQLERLAEANQRQQTVWTGIQESMKQFQAIFSQTERAASQLLNQISGHTTSYLEVTKKGYDEVVKVADEHFSQASKRLGASVNELDEYLKDLTETLGNSKGGTNGGRA